MRTLQFLRGWQYSSLMRSSPSIVPKRSPRKPSLLVRFAMLPEPRRTTERFTIRC